MKTILFKIQQFPHLSETFILSQIIMAIEGDYKVNILVKDVLDFEKSTHSEVLEKYKIREKLIIDDYQIPKNKLLRLIKGLEIILRKPFNWFKIKEYISLKSKFSLTWIYEIDFYSQIKDIDIIHIQYGTNVHPVDILKKVGFLNGKLICSFHGHDAFFPINGFIQNNGYYRHLFTDDNLIVANTPYLAKQIEEIGCPRKNIITIPVPVDTQYFTSLNVSQNNECIQLVTVGRLDPIKGHLIAVDFMNLLRKKGLKTKLTIIGEGKEFHNIKKKIEKLSLNNEIEMLGRKSQNEVREILKSSDVYLFTGVPVSDGRRETQGLATLEAQACKLPVLAFDSGGVKYTIKNRETGFLCPENDLNCLYEKLQLLMNFNLRQEMGEKARVFVEEHFSEVEINKKWRVIYDS